MSAFFVSGSSQFLRNSTPPITAVPFTVGFWLQPTVVSGGVNRVVWGIFQSSNNSNYFNLYINITTQTFAWEAGDGTDRDVTSGVASAGNWHYIILRAISATNRRISVLTANGTLTHAQETTSCVPTGLNRQTIGAYDGGAPANFYDGYIAEFFVCNADIQLDGAQLQDATMRKLAYGGPFSIPHIIPSIVEYRSFYSTQGSDTDKPGEVFWGSAGRQSWVNTAGVRVGFHPPLSSGYVRPADTRRILMV